MLQQLHGMEEKKHSIRINNFKINLYKSLPKFENYDTISTTKKLKLFSNIYLPIEILTDTYVEQKKEQVTYEKEELKQILTKKLEDELSVELGENAQITNKQVNEQESEDGLEVEVIYEVLENIGVKDKIIF